MYRKKAHIHFVGIGGIGMSGIAQILKNQGYTISGCDLDMEQQSIKDLKASGCSVHEGNNTPACNDDSINVLVYSSAIRPHNPEILAAQQRGIPTIPRALMLAELMRTKYSIGIAGSHGKTTTTSLVSHILIEAKFDPTVIIGGHLKNIEANARLGKGEFLVAETDESDRSFLHLQPTFALVTNIDLEHLETYKDLDDIKDSFKHFISTLPFYGTAIMCVDDANVRSILPISHVKTIKYGLYDSDDPARHFAPLVPQGERCSTVRGEEHVSASRTIMQADVYGQNMQLFADHSTFDVYHKEKFLGSILFHMPGRHNVLNALGATALALDLDVPFATIAAALTSFKGIERRFSYKGRLRGAEVFDDYGHHPVEIYNTLLVARKRAKKKLTVLFQPHRYTRTDKLWQHFIEIFKQSEIDHLIITDIFPASEAPIANVTSQNFVADLISQHPSCTVTYVPFESDFAQIRQTLNPLLAHDDLLLLLGAGKVNKLAEIVDE
jgi:UDP-N-acetylmuramate--alanine ligase